MILNSVEMLLYAIRIILCLDAKLIRALEGHRNKHYEYSLIT